MLILYFENSTFGVIISGSGRVREIGPVDGVDISGGLLRPRLHRGFAPRSRRIAIP